MRRAFLSLPLLSVATVAGAATLPPHDPLRILVVSDFVNPWSLPAASLTEGSGSNLGPGKDVSLTLLRAGTGLALDTSQGTAVLEVSTDEIGGGTANDPTPMLLRPQSDPASFDALVYFSHRIPGAADGATRQEAFVAAMEQFLRGGGGVLVFHHGNYNFTGKESVLTLIGARSSGVEWNTSTAPGCAYPPTAPGGQPVLNVAAGHFVTTNGLTYPGSCTYADAANGVPSATYPYFQNFNDERYPAFTRTAALTEWRALFASNYVNNGTQHVLGFVRTKSDWVGSLVAYQPGEYQPNILDDLAGPNFQVISNALVWTPGSLLRLSKTATAGEARLDWTRGISTYSVYRAASPAGLVGPANLVGSPSVRNYVDTPPAGDVWYYAVSGS